MSPQIIQSTPKQHPGMMRSREVFPKLNDRFILFNMTLFSDTLIVSRNFEVWYTQEQYSYESPKESKDDLPHFGRQTRQVNKIQPWKIYRRLFV